MGSWPFEGLGSYLRTLEKRTVEADRGKVLEMKFAIIGARVVLGLIFVVFGLNG